MRTSILQRSNDCFEERDAFLHAVLGAVSAAAQRLDPLLTSARDDATLDVSVQLDDRLLHALLGLLALRRTFERAVRAAEQAAAPATEALAPAAPLDAEVSFRKLGR